MARLEKELMILNALLKTGLFGWLRAREFLDMCLNPIRGNHLQLETGCRKMKAPRFLGWVSTS
jgi:hypothetical protein